MNSKPVVDMISVCVDYADLLAITLPLNVSHFRKILIVTSLDDAITQEIVARFEHRNVTYFATNAFYDNGAPFNKGKAIDQAFGQLEDPQWICLMDADIILPKDANWRDIVPGNLYGTKRRFCYDVESFKRIKASPSDRRLWGRFPFGKLTHIGFFQLFHYSDLLDRQRPWYADHFPTAASSDHDFYTKWPEEKRLLLPFEVLHLGHACCNWRGRKTDKWTSAINRLHAFVYPVIQDGESEIQSDRRLPP